MSYEPRVNDYVKWENGKGVEGWIYFKDYEYLTIETQVWPKDEENYTHCSLHRNERVLVICYNHNWDQLKYVKSREDIYDEK